MADYRQTHTPAWTRRHPLSSVGSEILGRKKGLSLELLQTFAKLLENDGDAAKTAADLDINQPSISKRLGHLQHSGEILTRPWLAREGKKWGLTAEGERVLPAVRDILRRFDELLLDVNDSPDSSSPHVRFACGRHAALGFVHRALVKFREGNPEAVIHISTLRGDERIEGVANGYLDLATVAIEESEIKEIARRDLHVEEICAHRIGLCCRTDSRYAKALRAKSKTLPMEAFEEFPLVLPERQAGIRKRLDDAFRRKNIGKLNIHMEIGGWGTILDYLQDYDAVGLISESALEGRKKDYVCGYFRADDIPPSRTRIVCRRRVAQPSELDLNATAKRWFEALKRESSKKIRN